MKTACAARVDGNESIPKTSECYWRLECHRSHENDRMQYLGITIARLWYIFYGKKNTEDKVAFRDSFACAWRCGLDVDVGTNGRQHRVEKTPQ